ncbi:MAG: putative lipid II flippase FtsW [Xanthomonadaceae bacterium]|nr:putative lipid II flippase FtsW [Rhodospirillaceae bacterium]NIA17712.1 putative lipid II flippase FtsW [Xanthomonadaceae bacterium]
MTIKKIHSPDYIFLLAVGILVFIGWAFLVSASSVISLKYYNDSYFIAKQQIIHGILPGIILFYLAFKIGFEKFKKIAPLLFFLSLFLLILVLIPSIGVSHGLARSWIKFGSISFQPSEIMKLSFIIYLSVWFSKRQKKDIKDFKKGFLPFIFLTIIVLFLIILQPDLGTAIIIGLLTFVMYFLAGAKKTHLALITVGGIFLFFILLKFAPDYQKDRLISFLNPQFDIQGIGYHINQAFLSIGSGGWFGVGFGQSKQKFLYLPEAIGDSIFAIIAEEIGFIFLILFLSLFLFIIFRGFQIAKKSNDKFSRLVVLGIISWLAIQEIVNIGAMVGLLPLTGVTLPLVSYGGSSIAVFLASMGMIGDISRYTK